VACGLWQQLLWVVLWVWAGGEPGDESLMSDAGKEGSISETNLTANLTNSRNISNLKLEAGVVIVHHHVLLIVLL
jgi:hypothetical protein